MRVSLRTTLLAGLFALVSCAQSPPPTPKKNSFSIQDGGSVSERKMAALIRNHPRQKRAAMVWDRRLHSVAKKRATDMLTRDYLSHTDPDGFGPNWHVTRSGYRLPKAWTTFPSSNQIESYLFRGQNLEVRHS